MQYAFKYCFGYYKACPTYLEMLVERRMRRGEAGVLDVEEQTQVIQLTIQGEERAA